MLTSIFISIIFLLACGIQGVTGFGTSLIAMPLLVFFIDVKAAVPLCILQSVIVTAYLSVKLREHMDWRKILPLIIGAMPGIYLGVTFLRHAESDLIKLLLGILISGYSTYTLIFKPGPRELHTLWAYTAGFGTGFVGSAFSIGGPPVIIYTTLTGWSKDTIKASITGLFFVSASITAVVHAASGMTDMAVVKYFLISAPFGFIGVYLGSILYSRISRELFIKTMHVLLIVLGLFMIVSSFQGV